MKMNQWQNPLLIFHQLSMILFRISAELKIIKLAKSRDFIKRSFITFRTMVSKVCLMVLPDLSPFYRPNVGLFLIT